jgi:hypothetical protein
MKTNINLALQHINREGTDKLIEFLETSDFYTAPCSTKFHLACPGGLAQHTINVIKAATDLNSKYEFPCSVESVIIAAIGHDLCKINFYKETDEKPTDPQMRYLSDLLRKAGLSLPKKLNKTYAGVCISHMLNDHGKKPFPDYVHDYQVEDQLPLGHGEKSLYIIQQFIKLTLDEALAIRWHMIAFDAGIHFDYPSGFAYREAVKKSKLVTIVALADIEATNLVEA